MDTTATAHRHDFTPENVAPNPEIARFDLFVMVATLNDLKEDAPIVVQVNGRSVALFRHAGRVFAVDNRCPHMGFPLQKGTVKDGILTCHWHHARFDLACGGTFDPWADDVRSYPVQVRGMGDFQSVWLDPSPGTGDPIKAYRERLEHGLRRNVPLIIAKALVGLENAGAGHEVALAVGAEFGTRYAANGWGPGLTILTAMANILPCLRASDRSLALYHGLIQVASECAGRPVRIPIDPLPGATADATALKRWFREFIEQRHGDGAERCLRTAVESGVAPVAVADMVFAACTDHMYRDTGHMLDFANKAFEMLDHIGWEHAGIVLTSLVPKLRDSSRMEESSSWRHPVDLAALLWSEFEGLDDAMAEGARAAQVRTEPIELVERLLGDDPAAAVSAVTSSLRAGASAAQIARAVTYAASLRIAQFHTRNEFADWNTVLHTFTYANAVSQALRRAPSAELIRAVYDCAASIYLDRFLNRPPEALPAGTHSTGTVQSLLDLLDTQGQVNRAGEVVASVLNKGETAPAVMAAIGEALLREDSGFHTYQAVEASFRLHEQSGDSRRSAHALVAAARYVAAHTPTRRAGVQTFEIAQRLLRGDSLMEV